ncbi:hypothetical protein ASG33_11175 [Dyadobacter sp. Leaf189]|nr:hypothetical protein ASG33_11175 [Dyadobacter sp. Leaf189]
MEQMKIDQDALVSVDFENEALTRNLKIFRPAVFKDGDTYKCLLGPDLDSGILGVGDTARAAMLDWDVKLNEFLTAHDPNDPLAQYVLDMLATTSNMVW